MSEALQILVIDDEVDMRTALAELLEDEGYTVGQAKNGKNGLEYLAMNSLPQLILLDYMMPEMDGAEFCRRLRSNPHWAAIPVVIVSAASIGQGPIKNLNVSGFVEKPLDIDKFLEMVNSFVINS